MQPTLQNGGLLCLSVFVVSFMICFLAARKLKPYWKFYIGYALVAVFVIAFIPEPTDAAYLHDIDARIGFSVFKGLAFLSLLFGVLLGMYGEKNPKSV